MSRCRGLLSLPLGAVLALASCNDAPDPTGPATSSDAAAALATTGTQLSFYQVSAGMTGDRGCGVTTTHQAYCWGNGYLGNGSNSDRQLTPVAVAGGHRFRMISTDADYSCAVTTDNRAFCWGANYAGQLGDGTTAEFRATPVRAAPGLSFRHVSTGGSTTCGLTTGGRVYCWGARGPLGDATTGPIWHNPPREIADGRTYTQVSVGLGHACAVATSGAIYCWGENRDGQIGDASTAMRRHLPSRVFGTRTFVQVSAGWGTTCAVTSSRRALCWGENGHGEVGDGTTLDRREPRHVAGTVLFDRVTVGNQTACGEASDNKAYCWGRNSHGQQGNGTTTDSTRPVAVAGNHLFAQLSAGRHYTCGVRTDARGFCWGDNWEGALGDGTTTERHTPTPIAGAS